MRNKLTEHLRFQIVASHNDQGFDQATAVEGCLGAAVGEAGADARVDKEWCYGHGARQGLGQ